MTPVRYTCDKSGIIKSIGGAWDQCALEQHQPNLHSSAMIGRNLLEAINSPELKHVYEQVHKRAWQGETFFLRATFTELGKIGATALTIRREEETIVYTAQTLSTSLTTPVQTNNTTRQIIPVCSYCMSYRPTPESSEWFSFKHFLESKEFIQHAGNRTFPYAFSHSFCPPCYESALAKNNLNLVTQS